MKSVHVCFFTRYNSATWTYGEAVCSQGRDNSDCRKTFLNSITVCSGSMGFLQLFDLNVNFFRSEDGIREGVSIVQIVLP